MLTVRSPGRGPAVSCSRASRPNNTPPGPLVRGVGPSSISKSPLFRFADTGAMYAALVTEAWFLSANATFRANGNCGGSSAGSGLCGADVLDPNDTSTESAKKGTPRAKGNSGCSRQPSKGFIRMRVCSFCVSSFLDYYHHFMHWQHQSMKKGREPRFIASALVTNQSHGPKLH